VYVPVRLNTEHERTPRFSWDELQRRRLGRDDPTPGLDIGKTN
jgi:hypothetical protein